MPSLRYQKPLATEWCLQRGSEVIAAWRTSSGPTSILFVVNRADHIFESELQCLSKVVNVLAIMKQTWITHTMAVKRFTLVEPATAAISSQANLSSSEWFFIKKGNNPVIFWNNFTMNVIDGSDTGFIYHFNNIQDFKQKFLNYFSYFRGKFFLINIALYGVLIYFEYLSVWCWGSVC